MKTKKPEIWSPLVPFGCPVPSNPETFPEFGTLPSIPICVKESGFYLQFFAAIATFA
jgi:hypothetical protein